MLKNPQGRLIRDAIAPTSAEVAELKRLYGRAVNENRKFTPAEYDRVTFLTNELHRQYHYHYFMNFYPPVELKSLINRYYHGDGPRQWGLHMGRRAVTEARVAWARRAAETAVPMESESSSASAYPLEPLADVPMYQELRHRLDAEAYGPTAPPTPEEDDDNAMDTWVEPRLDDDNDNAQNTGTASNDESLVDFEEIHREDEAAAGRPQPQKKKGNRELRALRQQTNKSGSKWFDP